LEDELILLRLLDLHKGAGPPLSAAFRPESDLAAASPSSPLLNPALHRLTVPANLLKSFF
jgi:hypothetical protein